MQMKETPSINCFPACALLASTFAAATPSAHSPHHTCAHGIGINRVWDC